MKKLLWLGVAALVVGGAYFAFRLWPLVGIDNTGAEKVVLLHGLGRSEAAMRLLESELVKEGYEVHNIGYPSKTTAPEELIRLVAGEVARCCHTAEQTVHFVGHSLGGLLIRGYLAETRPQQLGRVVQLGSPNGGSELADGGAIPEMASVLLERAGPAAMALTTAPDGFPASLPPPDFPVGVIAGTRSNPLTNQWIPIPNDGMVSVESARLEGAADFMTVDASHWELRNRRDVAKQVVHFLRFGAFDLNR